MLLSAATRSGALWAGIRRASRTLGILAGLVLLSAVRVEAQCALCGQATPYAGSTPQRAAQTFVTAALVLLVPVAIATLGIGRTLWRRRDPD
jgi:hypothetical protein